LGSGATSIPCTGLQSVTSRSTDDDIDLTCRGAQDIEDQALNFLNPRVKAESLAELDKHLPDHLARHVRQQNIIESAFWPLLAKVVIPRGLGDMNFRDIK